VFLLLWHGGGHLYNRRRGQRLFRWLEQGLNVLGGKREAGWLGSPASGARVNITQASHPFRRLEITLWLENRELLPLWLFDRLRGKRDGLIIRSTLRSPGRGEVEVDPSGRRILNQRQEKTARQRDQTWRRQEGPHKLSVAYRGPGAQRQVSTLEPWLEAYGTHLRRLVWHKTDPHIQLYVNIAGLLTTPSETFLTDLQAAVGGAKQVKK
jgi:hypothetical protein